MIAEPAQNAFFPDPLNRRRNTGGLLRPCWIGVNQKSGAAIEIGAQNVDTALGVVPLVYHHVLEFLMQEFFSGALIGRLYFHEVGQHAGRPEILSLAALDGGKETLHAFGGVSAMRENLFQRFTP